MDLVKRFYSSKLSSKKSTVCANKSILLGRRKSKRSNKSSSSILSSATSEYSEDNNECGHDDDDPSSNMMNLYKKKHQHKIKAVESYHDMHQKLSTTEHFIDMTASSSSNNEIYHHLSYSIPNQKSHISSPISKASVLQIKDNKITSDYADKKHSSCSKLVKKEDSTMYSPFTKRPEIIDSNYIPLPTVTRKYIDPPPDVILDAIPSLSLTAKNRQMADSQDKDQKMKNSSDPVRNNTPSTSLSVSKKEKQRRKLKIDTKRQSLGSNQIDPMIVTALNSEEQVLMPDISTWLSQTVGNA